MSHTYGEILQASFGLVFQYCAAQPEKTVFLDVGCGYGRLLQAAIEEHQCLKAIGIEKYRDKYDACAEACAQLASSTQEHISLLLEDINDSDADAVLAGLAFSRLLLFCNNVAFNQGTIHRSGHKFRALMDSLALRGVETVVVSAMELRALADRHAGDFYMRTTWSDRQLARVYAWPSGVLAAVTPLAQVPPQQALTQAGDSAAQSAVGVVAPWRPPLLAALLDWQRRLWLAWAERCSVLRGQLARWWQGSGRKADGVLPPPALRTAAAAAQGAPGILP